MANSGGNNTFAFLEGLNFISRQMKITLDYPSEFLFFFVSIANNSSLISVSCVFLFSFLGVKKRIRKPLSSSSY